MIKVFTYKEYLTYKNRKSIFPILLDLFYLEKSILLDYYLLVEEIYLADIVIIPVDIKLFFKRRKKSVLYEMISMAKNEGKIVWVYSAGDIGKSLNMDVFTFRFGGFHSKLDGQTFVLPAFIQDPYEDGLQENWESLKKEIKPQIGFMGHAHKSKTMIIREYLIYLGVQIINSRNRVLDYQSFFPTAHIRYKYLMQLKRNKKIRTNFILRKRYRAGATNKNERQATSLEFFENIKQNPYIFCLRGSGNFSIRFYETLAMGRIPVLINTDNRLPLIWDQWKNHAVITDFNNLEEDLLKFHYAVTKEEFEKIQFNNRVFWKTHLTREGFFIQMHHYFVKNYNI